MLSPNETNQMKVTEASTSEVQVRKEAWRVLSQNITCSSSSNYRVSQFFDILHLLDNLSSLESSNDFHIGTKVKDRAVGLLCLLEGNQSIDLPKVLPEGEECVSLTWERHPWKTFVTIYPDEIEGTTYHRRSGIRCTETLSVNDSMDPQKIFNSLAIVPKPNTVDLR